MSFQLDSAVSASLQGFVSVALVGLCFNYFYYRKISIDYLFVGGLEDCLDVAGTFVQYGFERIGMRGVHYLLINGIYYFSLYAAMLGLVGSILAAGRSLLNALHVAVLLVGLWCFATFLSGLLSGTYSLSGIAAGLERAFVRIWAEVPGYTALAGRLVKKAASNWSISPFGIGASAGLISKALVVSGSLLIGYLLLRGVQKVSDWLRSGPMGPFEKELAAVFGARVARRLVRDELRRRPNPTSREGAAMAVLARWRFEREGGGRPL